MNSRFSPGKRFLMDPIGLLYCSIISKDYPGNYTVTATLREKLNEKILQKSVDRLFKRLPLLNGKIIETENGFYHEILENTPKISKDKGLTPYEDYYNKGEGHVVQILYGERHIKIETIHSITDGRSALEILKGILIDYFKHLGVVVENGFGLDFDEEMSDAEGENAFEKFANLEGKSGTDLEELKEEDIAYKHEGSISAKPHVSVLYFDVDKIKRAAKSFGVSVNNYLNAHLLAAISKERDERKNAKPVIISFAADCRAFFPTKTFRNFATGGSIRIDEILGFEEIVNSVKAQTEKVDVHFYQEIINSLQDVAENIKGLPIDEQKAIFKEMHEYNKKITTSIFSNLGLVTLPPSIQSRVESLEFSISQDGLPYTFSVISLGNVLTMTITSSVEGESLENEIKSRLLNPILRR